MTVKSKILFVFILTAVLIFNNNNAQAAEVYDVIYNDVSYYNENPAEAQWITQAIFYAAGEYRLDPLLLTAVMEAESGFCFSAISPAGAIGLMQLMPGTADMLGVNPYNPLENVLGGASYLRTQLDNFAGWGEYGITYAVAAYNAGSGAVYKYGGVPNYRETRQYVINVAVNYQRLLAQIYQ